MAYDNIGIKQYFMLEYLGCCLDTNHGRSPCTNLSGESMEMKSLRKINTKLQFLYRQNDFLK